MLRVFIIIYSSIIISSTANECSKLFIEDIKMEPRIVYNRQPKDIMEDAILPTPALIVKMGYPCEKHIVITSDGYILEIHRVPYMPFDNHRERVPVLLVHGLFASSADWIIPGPDKSLALLLVNAGYDVWMVNVRGTRYSRKHVCIDPDKEPKRFFNFSFHEIALFDLPATIDYILNVTNYQQIFYIGHSQGTAVSFILCSELSEYNDKLKAVFSLSPIAFLSRIAEYLRLISAPFKMWQDWLERDKVYEFKQNKKIVGFCQKWCHGKSKYNGVCKVVIAFLAGANPAQMNATILPIICGHSMAGSSTKQILHFFQLINTGRFCKYDYGFNKNMEVYGVSKPPDYELENIRAPFHLFYSTNDILDHEKDVLHLFSKLKNREKHLVPDKNFNHIDYLYSVDAPNVLYKFVIDIINKLVN